MKRAAILCCFSLLLLAAPLFAQEVDRKHGDRILAIDDQGEIVKTDNVDVTSATYEKVLYDIRGRTGNEKDGNIVLDIAYGDAPLVYMEGRADFQKGRFESAASAFAGAKNAVELGKARKWLLEYAAIDRAMALREIARTDDAKVNDAIEEFKEALKANPKSIRFDEIQIGLAECYIQAGKYDEARRAAKALADVGTRIKQPIWLCRGQRTLADALKAEGQLREAMNAYQTLLQSAQREFRYEKNPKRKKDLAMLEVAGAVEQGWARVAIAESTGAHSDWQDAQSYFEGLVSRYPENESVGAAVLNGVGRCLLEKDPRAALFKFAEAEVTHFTAKNEVARALYLKAKACDKLAAETGSSRYRTMAEEARKELQEFYKDSEWAKMQGR